VAKQVLQFGLLNERGSFCGCEPSSLSLLAFEPAGQFFCDAEQKHSNTHIDATIAQLLAIGVATDAARQHNAQYSRFIKRFRCCRMVVSQPAWGQPFGMIQRRV
jgi:hypothetical protein